jgi:hypothetical protein
MNWPQRVLLFVVDQHYVVRMFIIHESNPPTDDPDARVSLATSRTSFN